MMILKKRIPVNRNAVIETLPPIFFAVCFTFCVALTNPL